MVASNSRMLNSLLLATIALLSGPEDPADRSLQLFEQIRGEDAEAREAARHLLTRLEPSFAPTLRKMAPFQTDSAVRSAIREAVPILFLNWGRELYAGGRIDESLRCFAEAAGAPDVDRYVRAKLDDAKGYIRSWFPRAWSCLGPLGYDCSHCPDLVKSIKGCFGPWGLGAVLEGSREEGAGQHFWAILCQMGDDVVPVFCRELESPDRNRKLQALDALGWMAEDWKSHPQVTARWISAIGAVAADRSETDGVRERAAQELQWVQMLKR